MKETKFDPHSHIGETHGVYTIIDVLDEKDKYGHYIYFARCNECGYERYAHYGRFSGVKSKTNVCNHMTVTGDYIQNIRWSNERLREIFSSMKQRCYNKNEKSYRWYGAKGIKVCNEWIENPLSFEEWSLNNGYKDNLTIDRINEDKDYSPDNCRWITHNENAKYKSTTSVINVDGEEHTGKDWSKMLGLGINRINTYIREYGLDNTIEFIKRFRVNPNLRPNNRNQSIYSVYMN